MLRKYEANERSNLFCKFYIAGFQNVTNLEKPLKKLELPLRHSRKFQQTKLQHLKLNFKYCNELYALYSAEIRYQQSAARRVRMETSQSH